MTTRILLVCMGNICRSPSAEGVLRARLAVHPELAVEVDSAGTHGYHVGDPPDPRSIDHAARRGVDIAGLRARQVVPEDFERFDLVLAMDRANLARLRALCPPAAAHKLGLMLDHAPRASLREVPDPYYGDAAGFEQVLDLLELAADGLVDDLKEAVRVR
jgi:protein-tyrosine phosphatase